jgi:tetratricopeptide (TPR) repeat protein
MIDKAASLDQTSLRWFYELTGGYAGPITAEAMRGLLYQGTVSYDTLVWNATFGQSWKPIRDTEVAVAVKDAPPPLPPPLPPRTVSKQHPRDFRADLEVLMALPAAIVTAVVLVGIGSLSTRTCLYISIIIAAASGFFLIRPIPKILLTRMASVFALAVAVIAAVTSNFILLSDEKQLRKDCQPWADRERILLGCTLIIQDQNESVGNRAIAYHNRGFTFHAKSEHDRAIADYTEAITLDPEDTTNYYNRGLVFHAKGDRDRAIADYSAAIKRDPKYESELEADFKTLDTAAYVKLVTEQREKREALRKEQIASLLSRLKEPKSANLDLDSQYKIYVRLSELEPNDGNYKRESDRISKQIAAQKAAERAAEEKARRDAELRAVEQKQAEAKKCREDLACVGEKALVAAAVRCRPEVERLAAHNFEWTDGWLESKFSHYRWRDRNQAIVTFVGDKIKYQNGFGAWTLSIYECDFDTKTERVVDVRAHAGRLRD